jgi:hypothetical protein
MGRRRRPLLIKAVYAGQAYGGRYRLYPPERPS